MNEIKNTNWSINVSDYNNLNVSVLEKILHDGDEYFKGIVDDLKSLINRAFTVLTIVISISGILITFMVNNINKIIPYSQKESLFIVLVLMLICAYCIFLLLRIIFPKKMNVNGDTPISIDYLMLESIPKNDQYKIFIYNSIESIQNKIEFNERLLQENLIIFEQVLKIVGTIFILSVLILIILYIK